MDNGVYVDLGLHLVVAGKQSFFNVLACATGVSTTKGGLVLRRRHLKCTLCGKRLRTETVGAFKPGVGWSCDDVGCIMEFGIQDIVRNDYPSERKVSPETWDAIGNVVAAEA